MDFAYVSLFVGTFIIYNTFSILVAQRTRDMAMLRAIGAGRRQLLRSLVAESVAVGVAASAVGLGVGVVLSSALKALLASVGLEIPSGATVVATGTITTAFVVGVTVTVVSALAPAVRASRVRPVAAMRDVAIEQTAVSTTRTVAGLVLGGVAVASFAAALAGEATSAGPVLGLGMASAFLAVFVLGPVIARPIVRLIGWPVARTGVAGSLARENATRSPKRTTATASALMVGVALVGFITILAASTKVSVEQGVDASFRSDFTIESGAWGEGGLAPSLATEVARVPGVEAVAGLRHAPVSAFEGSTTVGATDTAVIDGLWDLDVVAGSMDDVGEGAVAVRTSTAEAHGIVVGDTVEVTFARTGDVPLEVAAIYADDLVEDDYLVDLPTFEANVTDQFDARVFVGTVDGTDPADARAALEEVTAAYPNAELQDQTEFKAGITSQIDRMLNLIYGLLALAVVIALLGIANTLALSIHERRREIGLLRAVGMTRAQVRRTVRWEAVFIALLGTVLGTGLAVGGAWGIITALLDQDVTAFVVPGTQLAVVAGMAGLAGVLAAVGPARRAARLDVLDAIGR
jgi:putative ABC transport system permease protein